MPDKKPESVLVLIYDQHQQVLVLQRLDDENFWQSVTGSLEDGESPHQAAQREVLEETGIDIARQNLQLIDCQICNRYEIRKQWRHRYPSGTTHNLEYVFRLQVPADSEITLTEHSAWHWMPADTAADFVWSETNQQAIDRYLINTAEWE